MKLHELWIAPTSTVFARFGYQRLLAIRRPKKRIAGKKFCTNEEVIAEIEAHFEAKEKSFYKSGIEMLGDAGMIALLIGGDTVNVSGQAAARKACQL